MSKNPIILASSSPRRKQLLEQADVSFEIVTKEIDESFNPELELKEAVADIAVRKADAVAGQLTPGSIIIAADTIVVLRSWRIGKPQNREEAINILTQLQGTTHQVVTGVAIKKGQQQIVFAETTEVTMHPLSTQQIVYYVDTYKPYDKAGAYAIQEWIGVVGIQAIHGDFYNVMGLPVSRVLQEIAKLQ